MALELSAKNWKLGFGDGSHQRQKTVRAGDQGGGVCRPAKRAGNPDSVGEANADAWQLGKASLEGFLEF
jgi:hypothetical protein